MITEKRGQTIVEFALILPIFILLLVGLFDVGRAVYAYNTVNNAARQAARLAIVDQTPQHIRERGASEAVSLGIEATDVDVEFRLVSTPNVANSCSAFVADGTPDAGGASGITRCIAVVTVPYDYQAATPLIGNLIGNIQLTGESQFKLDFYCEGSPCPLGE